MIALDIPLLNLKSPYYVVQDADGDLLFETDYGVKYGISKSSSVPMAVCYSISVLLATVCRSIVSTCSFAGLTRTSTVTSTRFAPLRT